MSDKPEILATALTAGAPGTVRVTTIDADGYHEAAPDLPVAELWRACRQVVEHPDVSAGVVELAYSCIVCRRALSEPVTLIEVQYVQKDAAGMVFAHNACADGQQLTEALTRRGYRIVGIWR